MIGLLFKKALGFIVPNKIVLVLSLLLSVGGYLLIQSYKSNGVQREKVTVLMQNNQALEQAYNARLAEIEAMQQAQEKRQKQREIIEYDLNEARKRLARIENEKTCIDFDLGNDFASVFTADKTNH